MSIFDANFPVQGRIHNPELDHYRTELNLMRDGDWRVMNAHRLAHWRKVIRRLEWMAAAARSRSRSRTPPSPTFPDAAE